MEIVNAKHLGLEVQTGVIDSNSNSVVHNYVLLAEDHDDTRFLFKTMLERQPGIKVIEASNGEMASALAVSLRIDMVLVDRDLALLDGYSLTKRIRQLVTGRKLPIIMMSDSGESPAQAKAFEVGCDDYIVKPFPLGLLSTLLQRHMLLDPGHQTQLTDF